ncbi:BTB POZ domain protein [Pyrenophora tritici-repentis]|uniref:BTB multi-domain protein n=2 Tax=Pyrenophora tritici-repentis TaxID=45151 RepID=A0A2W1I0V8_9PLEO|nr:uncharacterized protein PTRG_02123 [Pyrenophora tritici-repentis Pt-1C-BFP]KAA8626848.1 BTB multi-domain protein [Pyrenophora tritici-repentis]EDU41561.1 predicted protein [Pyrenophora tritici-repentis Pt-1C-BFP]KAF7455285.1 BTB multi-domain protein [Pyrenophora tritici-repentis]KAF7578465.1 BTB multi-domain protein [Pyrenophora tritici-repentis]KAG9389034.1 BTB multi-domain protein [Pyrenophora tritici-repentis]
MDSKINLTTPHVNVLLNPEDIPLPPTPTKAKAKDEKLALGDDHADFTVLCDGQRYLTHRSILKNASPYFARMFHFNGQETDDEQVEIPDVNATSMKHILDYMYTSTYKLHGGAIIPSTDYCGHSTYALLHGPKKGAQIFKHKCPCAGKTLDPGHLLQHVRIYTLADYFGMELLKVFARQGVKDVLHVYWQCETLELVDALEEAFTATPDDDKGLKDVFVSVLKEHPGLVIDEDGEVAVWLSKYPEVGDEVHWDDRPAHWGK